MRSFSRMPSLEKWTPLFCAFAILLTWPSAGFAKETVGDDVKSQAPSTDFDLSGTPAEKHQRELTAAIADGDIIKVLQIAENPQDINRAVSTLYKPNETASLLPPGTDFSLRPVKLDAYIHGSSQKSL